MSDRPKEPTTILFEQEVSGGDLTLQYFDFLAQTLSRMLERGVDRTLLCTLLITLAQNEQFKLPTPLQDLAPGRVN